MPLKELGKHWTNCDLQKISNNEQTLKKSAKKKRNLSFSAICLKKKFLILNLTFIYKKKKEKLD